MYTLCSTEKAVQQQRQFETILLDMLLEQPYDTITISELCRRAGYTRKVFYRLFEQKADVIYAAVDQAILDYEEYKAESNLEFKEQTIRFFAYWKSQDHLLCGLEASKSSTLLIDHSVRHVLKENIQVLRNYGADVSPCGRETIIFLISGLFALVLDWHRSGYRRSIEEMAQLLQDLLTTEPLKVPAEENPELM